MQSTSWPNRHHPYFARLNELLRDRGGEPLIAIVGPGAVTRLCRPLLSDAGRKMSAVRKLIGDAARYSDQLLRRVPSLPLVSLEPTEVERALSVPHRLAVVDVSPRVLLAVSRDLPHARCERIDLSNTPLPFRADVIIAFNVICRVADTQAAMQNLLAGLAADGLLLIDDRTARRLLPADRFTQIAPKTYRETAGR